MGRILFISISKTRVAEGNILSEGDLISVSYYHQLVYELEQVEQQRLLAEMAEVTQYLCYNC